MVDVVVVQVDIVMVVLEVVEQEFRVKDMLAVVEVANTIQVVEVVLVPLVLAQHQ